MGAKEVEGFDTPVHITITSYRKRKHDTDGVSAKAALDGIVACGLLTDDSAEEVKSITFKSEKCGKGEEEKTIIEIECI
jgi:hypothetical protein